MRQDFTFSIRDDDINFFTSPSKLKEIYEPILDFCKPTLCITPFAGNVYKLVRDREDELLGTLKKINFVKNLPSTESKIIHPIHENEELVKLIKEWLDDGKVAIALHGITHNQTSKGYECESTNNIEMLKTAKKYTEALFKTKIKLFSVPNNSINKRWRREVSNLHMNIIISYGPKPNEVDFHPINVFSLLKLYVHFLRFGKRFYYPYEHEYSDHSEISSFPHSVFGNFNECVDHMDYCKNKSGNFVFATHSYAFCKNPEMTTELHSIAEKARSLGAKMVGVDEVLKSRADTPLVEEYSFDPLEYFSIFKKYLERRAS